MTDMDAVAEAVSELLLDMLTEKESVYVPGLGTFRVVHHDSQFDERPDGTLLMQPPRDEITFVPEV